VKEPTYEEWAHLSVQDRIDVIKKRRIYNGAKGLRLSQLTYFYDAKYTGYVVYRWSQRVSGRSPNKNEKDECLKSFLALGFNKCVKIMDAYSSSYKGRREKSKRNA